MFHVIIVLACMVHKVQAFVLLGHSFILRPGVLNVVTKDKNLLIRNVVPPGRSSNFLVQDLISILATDCTDEHR